MTTATRTLLRFRRILILAIVPNLVFALLAYATEDAFLISILNPAALSISLGVVAAYTPSSVKFLVSDEPPSAADWLGYGIVITWLAGIVSFFWSIYYRFHGQNPALLNTDIVSYIKWMYICGGLCHLRAPGSLREHVPKGQYIRVGGIIALAVFIFLLIANQSLIQTRVGYWYDHYDSSPTPADRFYAAPAPVVPPVRGSQAPTAQPDLLP